MDNMHVWLSVRSEELIDLHELASQVSMELLYSHENTTVPIGDRIRLPNKVYQPVIYGRLVENMSEANLHSQIFKMLLRFETASTYIKSLARRGVQITLHLPWQKGRSLLIENHVMYRFAELNISIGIYDTPTLMM
jgi:hypothetical protein